MEIRDTRNGEWHWVYNALLADPHLTAGEKLVYSSISTFGGHQTIHPTKEQLAERCGLDAKTVQRALNKLEEVGYLSVERSIGRGNANVYFLLKKPKGCNLCPFTKGDIEDDKRGHLQPEKGTETTPHIDKYKDTKDITANAENTDEEESEITPDEDTIPYKGFQRKPKDHNAKITLDEAERRYGVKFVSRGKEMNHVAAMHRAGYTDEQIFACVDELLKDDFWGDKNINFGIVAQQIGGIKIKKGSDVLIYKSKK